MQTPLLINLCKNFTDGQSIVSSVRKESDKPQNRKSFHLVGNDLYSDDTMYGLGFGSTYKKVSSGFHELLDNDKLYYLPESTLEDGLVRRPIIFAVPGNYDHMNEQVRDTVWGQFIMQMQARIDSEKAMREHVVESLNEVKSVMDAIATSRFDEQLQLKLIDLSSLVGRLAKEAQSSPYGMMRSRPSSPAPPMDRR